MSTYAPIMNALLAYIQNQVAVQYPGLPVFQTFRRGIVLWEQLGQLQNGVPIIRQPALFLYDGMGFGGGTETFERQSRATPPRRTITRTIVLYAQTGAAGGFPGGWIGGPATAGVNTSQADLLHTLIEVVEAALNVPDNPETGTLTLGGLVAYCRIEGKAFLSSPDIDPEGQGMATLPIEIRLP